MHGNIMMPAPAGQELAGLASEITALHLQAEANMRSCAEVAMAAGDRLHEAKLAVGHGQFGEWVAANCKFSHRRAREYMQIADKRAEIEAAMRCHERLSVRGCLRIAGGTAANLKGDGGAGAAKINRGSSVAPWKPRKTTHTDIMEAWMYASPEERRRFIQAAGHEVTDLQAPAISAPTVVPADRGDLEIPKDLSIPNFLRRQVAGPKLSDIALHCATLGWKDA